VLPLNNGTTNNAPIAVEDNFSTVFETALNVTAAGVLTNDTDSDNDTLSAQLDSGPSNGTLTVFNTDGSFTYVPNQGYTGTDSFTYFANDGTNNSVTVANVVITVTAAGADPALLAHLELNDHQTLSIAADSSGNNNTGRIQGAVYTADTNDGSSHAMDFDGIDDAVDLGPLNVAGNSLTLAAWIRADSFPGSIMDPRIISKATGTAAQAHTFMLGTIISGNNNAVLRGRVRTSGSTATLIANTAVLTPGQWYHT